MAQRVASCHDPVTAIIVIIRKSSQCQDKKKCQRLWDDAKSFAAAYLIEHQRRHPGCDCHPDVYCTYAIPSSIAEVARCDIKHHERRVWRNASESLPH